jgi:RHS repeat-associated protein
VTNGNKNWSDGTAAVGQQFGYAFDEIGNRTATSGLSNATYGANLLNQYTNRTVPGVVDVMGSATNLATVSVNNHRAYRHGNYYQWPLAVTNTSGPVYMPVTNLAVLNDGTSADIVATNIGHAYVPQTPESFGYDADGNLTNDGRWGYVWDAENRLISMQAISTVPTAAKLKLDFTYDYKGRRIQKVVSTWSSSTYVPEYTNVFVYDGWNMIGELNGANDALIRSYGWGLDLSGSMQGAGGVGGLIWVRTYGTGATTDFPCYDANGNVTTLVGGTEGLVLVGQNEYGPFGEPLRVTDEATNNPFRFSTKYEDTETGFLYYGYRYYNPGTGRWLSRDSLGENASANLYDILINDSVDAVDLLGLADIGFHIIKGSFNAGYGAAPSGAWSQPPLAGTGEFVSNPGIAGRYPGFADALIELHSHVVVGGETVWFGNVCNTVDTKPFLGVDDGDAGSVLVVVGDSSGKGGKFTVTGTYQLEIKGSGPGQRNGGGKEATYATVTLFSGTQRSIGNTLLHASATSGQPHILMNYPFSVSVELKPWESKVVLYHDVTINFPYPGPRGDSVGLVHAVFSGVTACPATQ